mmetsp:Transcript_31265/g.99999  ORF Transcript_31265/g.99999 Transcript_31265/m.99999 type:complete len:206 (-) Transcript_31265:16-633(-)
MSRVDVAPLLEIDLVEAAIVGGLKGNGIPVEHDHAQLDPCGPGCRRQPVDARVVLSVPHPGRVREKSAAMVDEPKSTGLPNGKLRQLGGNTFVERRMLAACVVFEPPLDERGDQAGSIVAEWTAPQRHLPKVVARAVEAGEEDDPRRRRAQHTRCRCLQLISVLVDLEGSGGRSRDDHDGPHSRSRHSRVTRRSRRSSSLFSSTC